MGVGAVFYDVDSFWIQVKGMIQSNVSSGIILGKRSWKEFQLTIFCLFRWL